MDSSYVLKSIDRVACDDSNLDTNLWSIINIHNKGYKNITDFGECIIVHTNNKNIFSDILQNTTISPDHLNEDYIYYGNFLYTPKENYKKEFEDALPIILENIRKSEYWIDIIGVQVLK